MTPQEFAALQLTLLHGDDSSLLFALEIISEGPAGLTPEQQTGLVPILLRLMRNPRSNSDFRREAPHGIAYNDPWDDGWMAAAALAKLQVPEAEPALFEFFASMIRTAGIALNA